MLPASDETVMAPGLWPGAFNDVITDLLAVKERRSFSFVGFPFTVGKLDSISIPILHLKWLY